MKAIGLNARAALLRVTLIAASALNAKEWGGTSFAIEIG
jgi:hypothetical protein